MVHAAGAVPLHLELPGAEGPLLADEDVEVVVSGVQAGVALCAERGAKHDEVLGDGGVDDVHGAHGPAGVVEHPLGRVRVERDDGTRAGDAGAGAG